MNAESEEKRIVEIHGIKMEVDLWYAKRIDTYRVGDAVKVMVKDYSGYKSWPGVIAGFCDFKEHPAIEILYLEDYNLNFLTFTDESDAEIAPFNDYEMVFSRADILAKIDRKIQEAEETIRELHKKREAFEKHFGKVFANELV